MIKSPSVVVLIWCQADINAILLEGSTTTETKRILFLNISRLLSIEARKQIEYMWQFGAESTDGVLHSQQHTICYLYSVGTMLIDKIPADLSFRSLLIKCNMV